MEKENIFTLTTPEGQEVDFEYLDTIEYENVEYLVLLPVDGNEIRFWKLNLLMMKMKIM